MLDCEISILKAKIGLGRLVKTHKQSVIGRLAKERNVELKHNGIIPLNLNVLVEQGIDVVAHLGLGAGHDGLKNKPK